MRILPIITSFLITFTVIINAQETQVHKKWFVDVGPSILALDVKSLKTYTLVGVAVSGGFLPAPNHQLSFDVIPSFYSGKLWDYVDNADFIKHKDEIKRNTIYASYLFAYNFIFRPSKIFYFSMGPAIGFSTLSTSYTGSLDIDNDDLEKLIKETDITFMFSISANINTVINISDKYFIKLGNRFIFNSKTDYKDNPDFKFNVHQFYATFGFRF